MLLGQFQTGAIGGSQQFTFSTGSVPVDGTNCVDHMLCRQGITGRDSGLAGRAATQSPTLLQEAGTGSPVNRAIDTCPAEQTRVGSVDDGINTLLDNVPLDE